MLEDVSNVQISLVFLAVARFAIQVDITNNCLVSSCADNFDAILNVRLCFSHAALSDTLLLDS